MGNDTLPALQADPSPTSADASVDKQEGIGTEEMENGKRADK